MNDVCRKKAGGMRGRQVSLPGRQGDARFNRDIDDLSWIQNMRTRIMTGSGRIRNELLLNDCEVCAELRREGRVTHLVRR